MDGPNFEEASGGEPKHRALRLLSLDGGGIRGISELIILDEIMHRVQQTLNLSTPPLPADYFDIICGTSTGGLIAVLLGRLRHSVPEAIQIYGHLAEYVFSDRKAIVKDGIFKASRMEKAIKDVVERKLGSGRAEESMFEGEQDGQSCKTFVCAVAALHIDGPPRLFRTWRSGKGPGYNCAIWEACRATSAAPPMFKRIQIGEPGLKEDFVDAGLGCNNPVNQLVQEAMREFGKDQEVSCIVSIGTGMPKVNKYEKSTFGIQRVLPLDLIRAVAKIATDSEQEALKMKERYRNCHGLYHRLNVVRGLENISLEEWKKLGEVTTHTITYLSNQEVSQELDEIVKALIGKPSQTYTLGHLDGAVRPKVTFPGYYLYPSCRADNFVTRKDPLMKIEQFYQNAGTVVTAKVVVLLGMGGSGKTQLALDFCQRAHIDGRFTAIFWINASSPDTVAQSYTTIAQAISKDKINLVDSEANVHLVKKIFDTWTAPWLLVFDNLDDPNAFSHNPLKGYFPRGNKGLIIVTSRHADSERLGDSITVSDMLEDEAMELLFRSSKREKDDDNVAEVKKITKRLGYLALAIDQAGAYIKGRIQFGDFLDHFEHRREDIWRKTPTIWDYRREGNKAEAEHFLSVATTWELSFDQITGDSAEELESKRHLLTLSAFFSRQNISEDLFRNSYASCMLPWMVTFIEEGIWDTYRYLDTVTELRNLSLMRECSSQAYDSSFSLHPLIQDWIKLRLDPQCRRAYTVESMQLLFHYMDSQVVQPTVERRRTILSHLDAALENDRSYLDAGTRLGESSLEGPTLAFAGVLNQHGRYEEAIMLYERLLGNKERLGRNHPEALKIASYLANVHFNVGWIKRAEQGYKRVLDEREKHPGPEHLDTLGTMQNLAVIYAKQDRYEEAERLLKKVLKGKEKQLGLEHPGTLNTANNLAVNYRKQGRYPDAVSLNLRVLKARKERLGENHPDTLGTLQNLAHVYNDQYRYDEAESIYQRAFEKMEEHMGWDYPDTMRFAGNLVDFYIRQSRYEDARTIAEKVMKEKGSN